MPGQTYSAPENIVNEQVREVLGKPPARIVRWGSLVLLALVLLLFILSAFIEYPEVVVGVAMVKPVFHPTNVYSRANSTLSYMNVKDGDTVNKGALLLILKDPYITNESLAGKSSDSVFAATGGKVVFQRSLRSGEVFQDSALILAVVPLNRAYRAMIRLPGSRSGNIQIGEKVYISLDNFPKSEFGELAGRVASRPIADSRDSVFVDIELPNGCLSKFGKDLLVYSNAAGPGEITVSETKLYRRILSFLK